MSDLAPFVAAVLRDKVMKELMEENEKLKTEFCRGRIQIISKDDAGSTVVHAEGFLADGVVGRFPDKLQIPLSQKAPCHLIHGRHCVQVRSPGGHHKADLLPPSDMFPLPGLRLTDFLGDEESPSVIVQAFDSNVCRLQLKICGCPGIEIRQEFQQQEHAGMPFTDYFLEFLGMQGLPERFPEGTITFETIWLDFENERGAIENLSEPDRSRILQSFATTT